MFNELKSFCKSVIPFTENELDLIDDYFESRTLKKKEILLQEETICDFLGFITTGCIRHFHIYDGNEKTCDISFENSWVTDFHSFTMNKPCVMNLQALEETTVNIIRKEHLKALYQKCNKFESFGRIMTERVANRATEIAMSFSTYKPEKRYTQLLERQPDLFQKVPQKHIANFLGISPESLSRIRHRIIKNEKS